MLEVRTRGAMNGLRALAAGVLALAIPGCAQGPAKMVPPQTLVAPYDASRGEVLWAVVPLRNESGTSQADPLAISDQVVAAIEEARGIRALPLNRTMEAMRALKMGGVGSPADARKLAQALGVDGLVLGSVTAYEPYEPTIGLSLALFARPGAMQTVTKDPLDVRKLAAMPAEAPRDPGAFQEAPVSVFTAHLDGKNHQVLLDVKAYAEGRHDPGSALNWKRYTASMELYTQFAANHAVGGLLEQEWMRLARLGAARERPEER
ncbi:MAG: hypothetical protein IT436_07300 [Phycisphaerales bacterium]|nr:hypothetical protein [Phycisphaerales bacterium]